jgi:hypothetical protein
MFKPHPYTRACVAVTDPHDPKTVNYLFASGLAGNVLVYTETLQGADVAVAASVHTLEEVNQLFGVAVYECVRANLGRGNLASPTLPKAVRRFDARQLSPVDRAVDAAVLASRVVNPTPDTPSTPPAKPG